MSRSDVQQHFHTQLCPHGLSLGYKMSLSLKQAIDSCLKRTETNKRHEEHEITGLEINYSKRSSCVAEMPLQVSSTLSWSKMKQIKMDNKTCQHGSGRGHPESRSHK
ncbi:hypothetical protein EK904_012187, partial [Melospiza melodia maxima]